MKKLLFLTIFICANFVRAEIGIISNSQELPTLVLESGTQARAIWKDGREAVSVKRINGDLTLQVDSAIYENGCNGYIASKCKTQINARAYEVRMRWEKHPDSAKIGKDVKMKFKEFPAFPLVFQLLISSFDHFRMPVASRGIPKDEFLCDDYRFLPNDPFSSPHTRITRWEVEIMSQNPEGGGMENRSIGGAYDVELVPNQAKNGMVVDVHGGYTSAGGSTFLVGGDIFSWTLKNKDQKFCQIGMKPDFATAFAKFIEYANNLPDTWESYVMGMDETEATIRGSIKNFLANPNYSAE